MIYIQTTKERFENGKKVLKSHGGKIVEKSPHSGVVSIKMVMQEIVAEYSFVDGEASFRIVKIPFFLTDSQVARYLQTVLE
jgi:hypothetical protein